MADLFGNNTTRLAVVNSRVSAGMGLGYAIASLVGGERNSHAASYCPGALFGVGGAPCHLPAMISSLQTPSSGTGPLAARDIRYAYAASCAVGCCVLACITFGFGETLTESRRVPLRENSRASSPLG